MAQRRASWGDLPKDSDSKSLEYKPDQSIAKNDFRDRLQAIAEARGVSIEELSAELAQDLTIYLDLIIKEDASINERYLNEVAQDRDDIPDLLPTERAAMELQNLDEQREAVSRQIRHLVEIGPSQHRYSDRYMSLYSGESPALETASNSAQDKSTSPEPTSGISEFCKQFGYASAIKAAPPSLELFDSQGHPIQTGYRDFNLPLDSPPFSFVEPLRRTRPRSGAFGSLADEVHPVSTSGPVPFAGHGVSRRPSLLRPSAHGNSRQTPTSSVAGRHGDNEEEMTGSVFTSTDPDIWFEGGEGYRY